MSIINEWAGKIISEKEGTFLEGKPVKTSYIIIYFVVCLLGIMVSVGAFLYELICNHIAYYGVLFGISGLFILFTTPAYFLIYFKYKISKIKRSILSDENLTRVKVIPYKVYVSLNQKNKGYYLEVRFYNKNEKVVLRTKKINNENYFLKPNREITLLYSPKYHDAIILP